jgi:hypothetical protein
MIKKYWVYAFFLFAVALFAFKRLQTQPQKKAAQVKATLKTFHTAIGWGYDVYRNNSLFIHQEYMPAVEGRKGFASEEEAKRIGELILGKMKNTDFPVVTLDEIKTTRSLVAP